MADKNRNGQRYRDLRQKLKESARGSVCHICTKPIDMTLQFPDKMSWSLDHILPLAKGGQSTWDNVAPAHLSCNSSKNKEYVDMDSASLCTRNW